ncbi:MAG: histidine phosphatase family protein, partial [Planctomycetota bacterium]
MSLIDEYPPADGECLLYLVRHGATPHNLKQPPRMQGASIDESLADLGRRQAARAAESLADRPFAAAYASPMKRAMETAGAIAAPHGIAVQPVEALREVSIGEWEGMTWAEIRAQDAERYDRFVNDPVGCGYPG